MLGFRKPRMGYLALVCLCVIVLFQEETMAAKAPQPPAIPRQFVCNFTMLPGGLLNGNGTLWFDYVNKGARLDYHWAFFTSQYDRNYLHTNKTSGMTSFYVEAIYQKPVCYHLHSVNELPPFVIPNNATYLGEHTIGTHTVEGWVFPFSWDAFFSETYTIQMWLDTTTHAVILLSASLDGVAMFIAQNSDFQIGPFDPSIYAVPSACQRGALLEEL